MHYLQKHAEKLYRTAAMSDFDGARAIPKKIENGDLDGHFSARDIYSKHWTNLSDPQEVTRALEILSEYRHLYPVQHQTGGRTKPFTSSTSQNHARLLYRLRLRSRRKTQNRSDREGAKGAEGSYAPSVAYEYSENFPLDLPAAVLNEDGPETDTFEERVAIMIYDGGLSELEAVQLLIKNYSNAPREIGTRV